MPDDDALKKLFTGANLDGYIEAGKVRQLSSFMPEEPAEMEATIDVDKKYIKMSFCHEVQEIRDALEYLKKDWDMAAKANGLTTFSKVDVSAHLDIISAKMNELDEAAQKLLDTKGCVCGVDYFSEECGETR